MAKGNKNKKKNKGVDETDPEALKGLGNDEYQKGNYLKAITAYTKAISVDGKNAIYFSNRAQAYITIEEYDKAVEDCDTALAIDPNLFKAYYRKAIALNEKPHVEGNEKKVIDNLEQALKIDADNVEIQHMLAFAKEEFAQDYSVAIDDPERVRFETLFRWMKKDGAEFDKMKVRYYAPDYRGVHAARNIKKGETILYVPKKEIITLEMAMSSPIGKLMFERNFRQRLISPKHSFLATYIMQERRKESSYFDEYIDILPKKFSNFPIFYTQEERAWLEGSPFQNIITEKIKDIQADYSLICKEVPEYRQFPLKEYSEMRMMVASRIFGIQIEGVKTDGFVAYADMLNHKRPRQTSWTYTDDREGFIIEALEDIKRGDQIYDSYGQKCNQRFLLNYGFINLNNDANEFPFIVSVAEDDQFALQKTEMLGGAIQRMFKVVVDFQKQIMSEFMSFIRFVEFDENITLLYQIKGEWEKRHVQGHDSDSDDPSPHHQQFKANYVPPISKNNEKKVHARIMQLCQTALSKYPTTMQDDLKLLENENLTFNERNSVLFRSGEKEILHFLLDFSALVTRLLDMKFKDAKRETWGMNVQFESCRDYLQNQVMLLIQKDQS